MLIRRVLIALLLLVLLTTACGGEQPAATQAPDTSPTEAAPVDVEPEPTAADVPVVEEPADAGTAEEDPESALQSYHVLAAIYSNVQFLQQNLLMGTISELTDFEKGLMGGVMIQNFDLTELAYQALEPTASFEPFWAQAGEIHTTAHQLAIDWASSAVADADANDQMAGLLAESVAWLAEVEAVAVNQHGITPAEYGEFRQLAVTALAEIFSLDDVEGAVLENAALALSDINAFVYKPTGEFYVVGLVENQGEQPLDTIELTAEFVDGDDNLLGYAEGWTEVIVVLPGETVPFILRPSGGTPDDLLATYDDYEITTVARPYEGLFKVTHDFGYVVGDAYFDSENNYVVEGTITNNSDMQLSEVQVTVLLYDSGGQIIGLGEGSISAETLGPGESADFIATSSFYAAVPSSQSLIGEGLP